LKKNQRKKRRKNHGIKNYGDFDKKSGSARLAA
jgi:hypothetical protein